MPSSREKRAQRHQSQPKQNIAKSNTRTKVTEKVAGSGYREVQQIGGRKFYTPLSNDPNLTFGGSSLGGVSSTGRGSSISTNQHGNLYGRSNDDHVQYILVDGTRAFSGNLIVGSDGSGHDVTFYSGTAGDSFVWDSSEELLTITGTDGQTALNIADGNVTIADTLTSSNIGAYTLTGKLTAGAQEIEGTAFDIDGGDLSAINISGGLTWSSAQNLNSQALTNVNIDSGDVSAITISGDLTWSSDQSGVSSLSLADAKNINLTTGNIVFTPSADDTVTIDGATNGVLNITTVDDAGANANINITADGVITIDSANNIIFDTAGSNNDVIFKNGGTERFAFKNDSTPELDVTGTFILDGSSSITIDSVGETSIITNTNTVLRASTVGALFLHGASDAPSNYFACGIQMKKNIYHFSTGHEDFKENFTMLNIYKEPSSFETYPS